jgi:4-hydroxybenzoate polyprenyltransferase
MSFFRELRHFPEFVKISHSVFALPFALGALLLGAHGIPSLKLIVLVIAAVVSARVVAMSFNRIVDAKFDAKNPRTTQRHLPSGKISPTTAWVIVILGVALFILTAWNINLLAFCLSPVALLFVMGYSLTKRFTRYSHFFLGLALALAPLGAWVAVKNDLNELTPWLLAVAVVFWVAGFDMIYAIQDVAFDKEHGLHSMIVAFGQKNILRLVPILHLAMLALLIWVGVLCQMGNFYYVGMIVVLGSLVWEQWLIAHLNEANLQMAFFQANAIASFAFLGAVVLGTLI